VIRSARTGAAVAEHYGGLSKTAQVETSGRGFTVRFSSFGVHAEASASRLADQYATILGDMMIRAGQAKIAVLAFLFLAGCKAANEQSTAARPLRASPIDAASGLEPGRDGPAGDAAGNADGADATNTTDAGDATEAEPALAHWSRGEVPTAPSNARSKARKWSPRIYLPWARSAGNHAPPLVLRGTMTPTSQEPLGLCDKLDDVPEGPRGMVNTVHITFEGKPRPLYLWALARGPLGVSINATCTKAPTNQPLRMDIAETYSSMDVRFGEVNRPKERSGRTFPFVMVLSDDPLDPKEMPDPQPALPPNAISVRWSLAAAHCPMGLEPWRCWQAHLELDGAIRETVPIAGALMGQSGCWPDGTGIVCAGASGMDLISVEVSPSGKGSVSEYHESDGYCAEGEECGTTRTLASFTVPPGFPLVSDPLGTFPP
jgi:hypothetical protein